MEIKLMLFNIEVCSETLCAAKINDKQTWQESVMIRGENVNAALDENNVPYTL